jgi:hypothetical protein
VASSMPAVQSSSVAVTAPIFQQDRFTAQRKLFRWPPQFCFLDISGNTLAFLHKKVFTWKDDIRVFTDQTRSLELLTIKARKIIDWGSAFDVTDSIRHEKVGVLKRRGWKSLVRSEWLILDAFDQEVGRIVEQSATMAIVRRFLGTLVPQYYRFEIRGRQVGTARQGIALFAPRMEVDFSDDPGRTFDRRLAVAATVLLMILEERQSRELA